MRKVQLALVIVLSLVNCILFNKVIDKYSQLKNLEVQKENIIVSEQTIKKQNTYQNKVEKKSLDYMVSKTWSKKYDRSGDRTKRVEYKKDVPIFKTEWTTWKGKKYIPKEKMKQLTEIVLKRMPHVEVSDNLINLVVETCIAESNGGYFIKSLGGDFGVLQLRINTVHDLLTWLKDNHKDIFDSVMQFRNSELPTKDNLETNIPYSIALCVCEYWRKAGPNFTKHIGTIKERAIMWKSVYNTKKGRGTVKAYITRNDEYRKISKKNLS